MPNLPSYIKVVQYRRISTSGAKIFSAELPFRAFYVFSAGLCGLAEVYEIKKGRPREIAAGP